jgi:Lrp/AsnC family transcriptional regulator of ectoine degradation
VIWLGNGEVPGLLVCFELQKAGLIRGYTADIALELVCDLTKVIVTLSLTNHRKSVFERFF